MLDLAIRGGTVIDGTGAPRRTPMSAFARAASSRSASSTSPRRELRAEGLMVTPGWVDVHTHYDGQVTWDAMLTPSCWHGVTTVVMGNCGVGFAPVRPGSHDYLIKLMEGVEDIPGTALAEGIDWSWESFPEYLDAIESKPHSIDVAAQIPHGALRFYVMGKRGTDHEEDPTADEIAEMSRLVKEGIEAGALGFTTSRTKNHRTSDGRYTPSLTATADELLGIGGRSARPEPAFRGREGPPAQGRRVGSAPRSGARVGRSAAFVSLAQNDAHPRVSASSCASSMSRTRRGCR